MTVAVIDTAVAYTATTVYTMDISKIDIVVLYSLSICIALSISSLYGYYGAYRESRRNLQDDKPNPLSKRKRRFDFDSIYERHLSILLGPLLVIAITIDSIVVLYATNLSNALAVILYSLSIALVSSISLLLGYYRTKRQNKARVGANISIGFALSGLLLGTILLLILSMVLMTLGMAAGILLPPDNFADGMGGL